MRILAVADEECPALWDHYVPGRLQEYDLILSCGDLKASYLSFLVTMARCPVLYVHGNHDGGYKKKPPLGCDCIDDYLVIYNGLRILGLGGCAWYHPGPHQYTEKQMRRRIRKLRWKLWLAGGVDIVVTHAPPEGMGDLQDNAHRGFAAFRELIEKYQPQYFLHGHTHVNYGPLLPREHRCGRTRIINVGQKFTLDISETAFAEKHRNRLRYVGRPPKQDEEIYGILAN